MHLMLCCTACIKKLFEFCSLVFLRYFRNISALFYKPPAKTIYADKFRKLNTPKRFFITIVTDLIKM